MCLPYTTVITNIIEERKPYVFLFVADEVGRDLAPRIACRIRTGLATDNIDLKIEDFYSEISGARTFCSFDELYYLKSNNLIKGAGLDRGVVFMNNNADCSVKIKELFNNKKIMYDYISQM